MRILRQMAVHHTGGLENNPYASTAHYTAATINEAHRQRWNFISSLGEYGGYNLFIEQSGLWFQFRAIGEETAAQRGHNKDTVSPCFAGNFNLDRRGRQIDQPSAAALATYKKMTSALLKGRKAAEEFGIKFAPNTDIKLSIVRIFPHRFFVRTECYGNSLNDDWARQMILDFYERKIRILERLVVLLIELMGKLKKKGRLGSGTLSCEETARG